MFHHVWNRWYVINQIVNPNGWLSRASFLKGIFPAICHPNLVLVIFRVESCWTDFCRFSPLSQIYSSFFSDVWVYPTCVTAHNWVITCCKYMVIKCYCIHQCGVMVISPVTKWCCGLLWLFTSYNMLIYIINTWYVINMVIKCYSPVTKCQLLSVVLLINVINCQFL